MAVAQIIVLAINVAWFGLAFREFTLTPRRAIKMLVPKGAESEVAYESLLKALPFLGGFNLAFAVLCAIVLVQARSHAPAWPVFLSAAVAHASQFACNVPHALRGGRGGGAPWNVRGKLRFIFVTDALCALCNAVVVLWML